MINESILVVEVRSKNIAIGWYVFHCIPTSLHNNSPLWIGSTGSYWKKVILQAIESAAEGPDRGPRAGWTPPYTSCKHQRQSHTLPWYRNCNTSFQHVSTDHNWIYTDQKWIHFDSIDIRNSGRAIPGDVASKWRSPHIEGCRKDSSWCSCRSRRIGPWRILAVWRATAWWLTYQWSTLMPIEMIRIIHDNAVKPFLRGPHVITSSE